MINLFPDRYDEWRPAKLNCMGGDGGGDGGWGGDGGGWGGGGDAGGGGGWGDGGGIGEGGTGAGNTGGGSDGWGSSGGESGWGGWGDASSAGEAAGSAAADGWGGFGDAAGGFGGFGGSDGSGWGNDGGWGLGGDAGGFGGWGGGADGLGGALGEGNFGMADGGWGGFSGFDGAGLDAGNAFGMDSVGGLGWGLSGTGNIGNAGLGNEGFGSDFGFSGWDGGANGRGGALGGFGGIGFGNEGFGRGGAAYGGPGYDAFADTFTHGPDDTLGPDSRGQAVDQPGISFAPAAIAALGPWGISATVSTLGHAIAALAAINNRDTPEVVTPQTPQTVTTVDPNPEDEISLPAINEKEQISLPEVVATMLETDPGGLQGAVAGAPGGRSAPGQVAEAAQQGGLAQSGQPGGQSAGSPGGTPGAQMAGFQGAPGVAEQLGPNPSVQDYGLPGFMIEPFQDLLAVDPPGVIDPYELRERLRQQEIREPGQPDQRDRFAGVTEPAPPGGLAQVGSAIASIANAINPISPAAAQTPGKPGQQALSREQIDKNVKTILEKAPPGWKERHSGRPSTVERIQAMSPQTRAAIASGKLSIAKAIEDSISKADKDTAKFWGYDVPALIAKGIEAYPGGEKGIMADLTTVPPPAETAAKPGDAGKGPDEVGKGRWAPSGYTFYAPGAKGGPEGPFATSGKGLDGKNTPKTLDDVREGKATHVTVAGKASEQGKTVDIGTVTYTSPKDGKSYTLEGVKGYVHDTGGYTAGKGKYAGRENFADIAIADFRGWTASPNGNAASKDGMTIGLGSPTNTVGTQTAQAAPGKAGKALTAAEAAAAAPNAVAAAIAAAMVEFGKHGPLSDPITSKDLWGVPGVRSASRGPNAHQGEDWGAPYGTPVSAIKDGVITAIGKDNFGTPTVTIDHGKGLFSRDMHLSPESVVGLKAGQAVVGGRPYAASGRANGVDHLHHEVWLGQPGQKDSTVLSPSHLAGRDARQGVVAGRTPTTYPPPVLDRLLALPPTPFDPSPAIKGPVSERAREARDNPSYPAREAPTIAPWAPSPWEPVNPADEEALSPEALNPADEAPLSDEPLSPSDEDALADEPLSIADLEELTDLPFAMAPTSRGPAAEAARAEQEARQAARDAPARAAPTVAPWEAPADEPLTPADLEALVEALNPADLETLAPEALNPADEEALADERLSPADQEDLTVDPTVFGHVNPLGRDESEVEDPAHVNPISYEPLAWAPSPEDPNYNPMDFDIDPHEPVNPEHRDEPLDPVHEPVNPEHRDEPIDLPAVEISPSPEIATPAPPGRDAPAMPGPTGAPESPAVAEAESRTGIDMGALGVMLGVSADEAAGLVLRMLEQEQPTMTATRDAAPFGLAA